MNEEPIRVAHIVGKMVGGGVEAFIMNYYRNIDRTKVQFDFIIDSDSTVVPKDEIEKMGGRIFIVTPYQKVFSYIKEIRNILKENKYKIVHSHLNSLSVFPLLGAYLERVPVRIAHSHSTTNKKEWKKNTIKNLLRPFSRIFATHFFACSEHAARWLFGNKKVDSREIVIVRNAIDIEKFKFNLQKRKFYRKKLNLTDNFVIGHVGRFVEQKNHEFLINIFYELNKIRSDAKLILIGDGPLEKYIKNKIQDMNLSEKVLLLGNRDDVNDLIQVMDCFVFPSLYEGLGIALIEAQVTGIKCLCSKNVPFDANVSKLISFLDLNDDYTIWVNKILEEKSYYDEKENIESIRQCGYDILEQAHVLERKYLSLI